MGLFDIPSPVYSAIDSLLAFLPLYGRLLIWAVFTGVISMILYWACSAQDKVEAATQRAIAARRNMAGYEGTEMNEMLPLAKESLAASGKHFLIVLGPAVLSSLPALTLIVWVSNHFSYELPAAGTPIAISSAPADLANKLTPANDESGNATIAWPAADQPAELSLGGGETLVTLPLAAAVPIVHQRYWWNILIGNPNGYLPEDSGVTEIQFALPRLVYLDIGPEWVRTWELSYFLLLILVSLGIKVAFKIH